MKRTKFTDETIAFALSQAETGTRVGEVCRKLGISEPMYYNWKKKCGGMSISEARRLKQLEDENWRLKQMVVDLSLDKRMLQDVLKKSSTAAYTSGTGGFSSRSISSVCQKSLLRHANISVLLPLSIDEGT